MGYSRKKSKEGEGVEGIRFGSKNPRNFNKFVPLKVPQNYVTKTCYTPETARQKARHKFFLILEFPLVFN